MLRFRRILHPHDFSKHASYAFDLACSLAHDHGAELIVVHVNPLPSPALMPYGAGAVGEEEIENFEANLRNLKCPFPEVPIRQVVVTGNPAEDILRLANNEGCDLIVLGTHGRKGLSRLLMGSVAEQVTRRARCPVITVRNPVAFEEVSAGTPAEALA